MYYKFKDTVLSTEINNQTFTFNFQSNQKNYSKFQMDTGCLKYGYYDSDYRAYKWDICQNSPNHWTNTLYKYIYIGDSIELSETFKTWLQNNTTECTGYFDNINNIHYFIDMKDSPDTSIQSKFNTSATLDKYKPIITPFIEDYFYDNFNTKLFKGYYLIDNNYNYINYTDNKLINNNDKNYSTVFLDDGNYIKCRNLITNQNLYLIAHSINQIWYITLSSTIPSGSYKVKLDNNKLCFTIGSQTFYYNGNYSTNGFGLTVTTTMNNAVDVSKELIYQKNINPISTNLHYIYNENYLGIEYPVTNINIREIAGDSNKSFNCLPYTSLDTLIEIENYNNNIFSGHWLVDGEVKHNLTYILPNTTTYIPLYYKQVTITNNTLIANIPLKIAKFNSNIVSSTEQYITGDEVTSRLNNDNISKTFTTSKANSLTEWNLWKCFIDYTNSNIRDADRACYFDASGITQSTTYTLNDIWAFDLSQTSLNYKLEYVKFNNITRPGYDYITTQGTQILQPNLYYSSSPYYMYTIKLPSYIYGSAIGPGYYSVKTTTSSTAIGNAIDFTYITSEMENAYIKRFSIGGDKGFYQSDTATYIKTKEAPTDTSISSSCEIYITGHYWPALSDAEREVEVYYRIYGCPKFTQITS